MWFLNPKVLIPILLGLLVTGAVSYHFIKVAGLQESLNTANGEITTYKADIKTAREANDSLQAQLLRKTQEAGDINTERAVALATNAVITQRLNSVQDLLNSQDRIKRQNELRQSKKAQLLLEIYNANVTCWAKNFGRLDGVCRAGQWVANGL